MKIILYFLSVAVLIAGAFFLFRRLTRRDYREKGQLSPLSSILELILCIGYVVVPYIYNPPCWPYVWSCASSAPRAVAMAGYVLLVAGVLLAFGSMAWLGVLRSFGRKVTDLHQAGPYRFTRNPQVLGGLIMVAGVALLWPSWYALGWVALWMVMFHMMVLTEEEHLLEVFGEEYVQYCRQVSRYLGFRNTKT